MIKLIFLQWGRAS